jgi:hypothetical protein
MKYREQGKNIESCKGETPSHLQRQTCQNNSRFFNRNLDSKEGME